MKHLNPSEALRTLARRYRHAEDAGFPDIFLIVICGAGGLATAGVALLAFVPTHAVLLVAYVLVLATTVAVLVTVVVMVNGEESEGARSRTAPEDATPVKSACSGPRVRRPRAIRSSTTTVYP